MPKARPASDAFYHTRAWKAARHAALIRDRFACIICGVSVRRAARVDHIQPLRTHPHLALSLANLRTLCPQHDNQAHREKWRGSGAQRVERFVITGCDANGMPADPNHHWYK
jgi:5-methylcytosine-specific restriction endonuclease McrA